MRGVISACFYAQNILAQILDRAFYGGRVWE